MPDREIIIKEARSVRDLRKFIDFPFKLYNKNPFWVPALRSDDLNTFRADRNPAFEFCRARYWLAYRENKPVGRIAGIINQRHIDKWGQRYARFGWIDFVDDPMVAKALLETVENWAKKEKLEAVHGPLGFTDLDREGMLVEGFDELGTLATFYNYPYYPQYMEQAGYKKDIDWVEFEIQIPEKMDERITKLAATLMRRYNLRLVDVKRKKELLHYAPAVFDLLDDTYSHLYGTTPLTREQVNAYINQYFGFVSPDFVPVVVDANDNLVAFGITLPSLSKALQKSRGLLFPFGFVYLLHALKMNDKGDLYLVAIHKDYQGRGVNAIMMTQILQVFNDFGIRSVESNPELETNLQVQTMWKNFEHRQHKRRRIFIKRLA
jgi:GNAT superfamily N-acetyltransferase